MVDDEEIGKLWAAINLLRSEVEALRALVETLAGREKTYGRPPVPWPEKPAKPQLLYPERLPGIDG